MKEIVKNYLEREVFSAWKKGPGPEVLHDVELQINSICDLRCEYCYCKRFGDTLFPPELSGSSKVLTNLDILLDWFDENNMNPRFSLFSGELFSQSLGRKVLERIVEWLISNNYPNILVIPTNSNFIDNEKTTEWVSNIIKYAGQNNIEIKLSHSIDGFYAEKYRPKRNIPRSDNFYDKLFKFGKEHNSAFHPMIYSKAIFEWKKNFDWFIQNLERYGFSYSALFLLEVRNYNWTPEQVSEYYNVIRYICSFVLNLMKELNLSMSDLIKTKIFNLLGPFYTIGRGISCSIQSSTQIRLGDLTVHPCHRTNYPALKSWSFVVENNKIVDIEVHNPMLYMAVQSANINTSPMCECCFIKEMCYCGCLGSQYEVTGDLFTPIPTVCRMAHAKVFALLDEFYKQNLLDELACKLSENKKATIELYKKNFRRI